MQPALFAFAGLLEQLAFAFAAQNEHIADIQFFVGFVGLHGVDEHKARSDRLLRFCARETKRRGGYAVEPHGRHGDEELFDVLLPCAERVKRRISHGQRGAADPVVARDGPDGPVEEHVDPDAAAEFSFLMSAPLICGGVLLELVKGEVETTRMSWGVLLWGTVVAAVVGYFSLALLVKALKGRWFWLFGPYCIVAGLCTLIFCR